MKASEKFILDKQEKARIRKQELQEGNRCVYYKKRFGNDVALCEAFGFTNKPPSPIGYDICVRKCKYFVDKDSEV